MTPILDHILRRAIGRIVHKGSLTLIAPSGQRMSFGDGTGEPVTVRLTDKRAVLALLTDPDMRLGELYMDGRFVVEQGSIYDFVYLMLREAQNRSHPLPARLIDRARASLRRFRLRNLPARSKRNVAHHYDLDGRLYSLFLDADRQYSCAYFQREGQSLEEAQAAKKRHIIAKLRIEPPHRVLDIGSGWGGLACSIAEAGAAEVRGVTLSEEQLAYARARPKGKAEGHVHFDLTDYRAVEGRFDRIVSVGMFEHVGVGSYGAFFRTCHRLLADNGVMLLHTIGCSAEPGFTTPWLDKYIFPGGYIPSLSEILPEIEQAGLFVTDVEVLRLHYALTLRSWRERFLARWDDARDLYDERFCRMWEYYLAAAEVAFRCEDLVVFQIQLARRNDTLPLTRDYIGRAEQAPAAARTEPDMPALKHAS
ncbi:replicative DNA helicase [Labrys miyagiensis]|uniref:Replicative DNA helicase n=1 Tax=Labrys miyagiensis TaxID=346912 RepID=A0ABQ6CB67_9HYPH|nr:cyclopropane-fatty-acyl-phospholipid synthase family protein [Labrys miyagiensis]GLS17439.1 replicative DNA helicase [Labrys miyagiensis]